MNSVFFSSFIFTFGFCALALLNITKQRTQYTHAYFLSHMSNFTKETTTIFRMSFTIFTKNVWNDAERTARVTVLLFFSLSLSLCLLCYWFHPWIFRLVVLIINRRPKKNPARKPAAEKKIYFIYNSKWKKKNSVFGESWTMFNADCWLFSAQWVT